MPVAQKADRSIRKKEVPDPSLISCAGSSSAWMRVPRYLSHCFSDQQLDPTVNFSPEMEPQLTFGEAKTDKSIIVNLQCAGNSLPHKLAEQTSQQAAAKCDVHDPMKTIDHTSSIDSSSSEESSKTKFRDDPYSESPSKSMSNHMGTNSNKPQISIDEYFPLEEELHMSYAPHSRHVLH